jgi:hypothetical protein
MLVAGERDVPSSLFVRDAVNRQRAIDFILREVKAARQAGLNARLLVPLTRSHSAAALQFELELAHLDQLDQFRERGVGTSEETGNWMPDSARFSSHRPWSKFCAWRRRSRQCSALVLLEASTSGSHGVARPTLMLVNET